MLESFRKASQSWFIKILFGLLIISFIVFFGNSSELLRLSTSRPAIVVGHQEISAQDVAEQFRRETERAQGLLRTHLTPEQARQLGLMQETIRQIVSRALLAQAANDLKFTLDDDSLRRMIANTPVFQNQAKVFDKTIYERVLARSGLSEAAFLEMSRQDAMRQDVVSVVQSGSVVPKTEADPLFGYRFERRVAEVIAIPVDKMAAPAKPADSTLEDYWKAHPAQFTAPQMRAFSAVVIRLADVATGIKPSEADIAKSYQVRQGEFQTPEKRAILQVVFDDEAKAKAFADSVKTPKDFAAAAKRAGKSVNDLGTMERKDLPLAALGDAAFALTTPGVAQPVKSDFGWNVLAVTSILAPKIQPLAEVRPTIVADLVKDEATNRLFNLSTKLEDATGAGAGIDEAAAAVGVAPLKVAAVDQHGNGPDGKPVGGLPRSSQFMSALFETAPGSTTEVKSLENDSGYFVLHVDSDTPPTIKPFASVRDQVLAAWNHEERQHAAHKAGEALKARLEGGETLAQVAKGYQVVTTEPFRRSPEEATKDIPPLLVGEMFKAAPGGVAVVDTPSTVMVARLKSVQPADKTTEGSAYAQLRGQLTQSLAGDLMQQYLAFLQKDYGVVVHDAIIQRQIEGSR